MFISSPAFWLATSTTFLVLTASAQTAPVASPASALPDSPSFRSAMESYKPFSDDRPIPWVTANDTVRRHGGWLAYAREASEPSQEDGPARKPDTADPHAGHAMPATRRPGAKP